MKHKYFILLIVFVVLLGVFSGYIFLQNLELFTKKDSTRQVYNVRESIKKIQLHPFLQGAKNFYPEVLWSDPIEKEYAEYSYFDVVTQKEEPYLKTVGYEIETDFGGIQGEDLYHKVIEFIDKKFESDGWHGNLSADKAGGGYGSSIFGNGKGDEQFIFHTESYCPFDEEKGNLIGICSYSLKIFYGKKSITQEKSIEDCSQIKDIDERSQCFKGLGIQQDKKQEINIPLGWKIFKNEKQRYTIVLPQEWLKHQNISQDGNVLFLAEDSANYYLDVGSSNPPELSITKNLQSTYNKVIPFNAEVKQTKPTNIKMTVAGISVILEYYIIQAPEAAMDHIQLADIPYKDFVFHIEYKYTLAGYCYLGKFLENNCEEFNRKRKNEYDNIFDNILYSFQFMGTDLDKPNAPIDETFGWRVHRDEESGFEIKYPADFFTRGLYNGVSIDSENFEGEINAIVFAGEEKKSLEECIISDINSGQGFSPYKDKKIIDSTIFYHSENHTDKELLGAYCGMSTGCHYKDIYRTFYNDSCYQIEYERSDREFMEGNPYNNPKILGDVGKVPDIFYEIFSTFRFLK